MTFEGEMSYARMTTQDPNALKRFVQRRRLAHGLRAVRSWDPADGLLLRSEEHTSELQSH